MNCFDATIVPTEPPKRCEKGCRGPAYSAVPPRRVTDKTFGHVRDGRVPHSARFTEVQMLTRLPWSKGKVRSADADQNPTLSCHCRQSCAAACRQPRMAHSWQTR